MDIANKHSVSTVRVKRVSAMFETRKILPIVVLLMLVNWLKTVTGEITAILSSFFKTGAL